MDQPAGAPPSPPTNRLERFGPIAVLILLPCLLVLWTVRKGGMVYGVDMVTGSYYIRSLVGQELAQGRAAVWDPNAMCGFPLMAALQASVFYPLTWPILLLGPGAFWTFTVLVHLILTGLFTYGWLKNGLSLSPWAALVGGLVTMFSGYFLTHLHAGHISQISSFSWLPALLWRVERFLHGPTLRRWTLLAASMATLILPGFPEMVFFGGLLTAIRFIGYALQRPDERNRRFRVMGIAGAAFLTGGLLAAPQLLPTLELIPHAQRVTINTYEFATSFSMPPENLTTIVAPGFFGGTGDPMYWGRSRLWESCGFVGLGALALAALALGGRHPQRFVWAAVGAAALLLALGSATPLFRLFWTIVPGADLFRAPGRYLALFTVAAAALAAMGFDRWWRDEEGIRRARLKTAVAAGAILVAVIAVAAVGSDSGFWRRILAAEESGPEADALPEIRRRFPDFPERAIAHMRRSLAGAALGLGAITAALLLRSRKGAIVLGAVLAVELTAFAAGTLRAVPDDSMGWPAEFVRHVKEHPGGPYRIASPGTEHSRHVGQCQIAGLHHVSGYEAMLLRGYAELMNAVGGLPPETATVTAPITGPHPVLDMLGAKFWLVRSEAALPADWKRVARVQDCDLVESPRAFPRAFLVPKAVSLPERDVRLRYLTDSSTDFHRFVVLESAEPVGAAPREGSLGTVRIVSSGPGRYEIAAETESGGYLVLTEADYPGWEARVDGSPAEILRANHFVQAIWLPAGRHAVRFDYHSTRLGAGFALCLLAVAIPAGLAVRRRRRAGATGIPPSKV